MKAVLQIIRIGNWEILPSTNQIRSKDSSLFLKPRLMRLLVFLLEHPNLIVTKEEVIEVVWEDRIVTDNLLTKSISELRQVIQEDFAGLIEIKTIRSVGYVLHCHGKTVFLEEDRNGMAHPAPKPPGGRLKKRNFILLGLGIGLILMIAGLIFLNKIPFYPEPAAGDYEVVVSPITSKIGMEWQAAISPEGANLVYTARKSQNEPSYLYVRHLDSANARRLTTGEGKFELNPAWSPDGQKIAFLRIQSPSLSDLQMIPLAGGAETSLVLLKFYAINANMIWIDKPDRLIFSAREKAEQPWSVYAFDLDSREIRQLTFPENNMYGDHFPNLVKKDQLTFVRSELSMDLLNPESPGKGKIISLNLKNGMEQIRTVLDQQTMGMAYSKSLDKMVFWLSEQEGYSYEMQMLDKTGALEKIAEASAYRPTNLVAHPLQPYLIYEAWGSLLNIHILNYTQLKPLLQSTHWDWHPRFSAGEEKIAFLSSRNGPMQVWLCDKDKPDQAVPIGDFELKRLNWLSLSPDAEVVLLQGNINGVEGIYKLEVRARKLSPLKTGNYIYAFPEFASDGQSVFYSSNQSGMWQIWRCDLDGNGEEMITKDGGYKALLRDMPDGPVLFYTPFLKPGLFKMNLETKQSEQLFSEEEYFDKMNFSITEMGVYYFQWKKGRCYLRYFDFETREFNDLLPLDGIVPEVPSLAVGEKGTILIALTDEIEADLLKVEIRVK